MDYKVIERNEIKLVGMMERIVMQVVCGQVRLRHTTVNSISLSMVMMPVDSYFPLMILKASGI